MVLTHLFCLIPPLLLKACGRLMRDDMMVRAALVKKF